jgi:hypothetical protein
LFELANESKDFHLLPAELEHHKFRGYTVIKEDYKIARKGSDEVLMQEVRTCFDCPNTQYALKVLLSRGYRIWDVLKSGDCALFNGAISSSTDEDLIYKFVC